MVCPLFGDDASESPVLPVVAPPAWSPAEVQSPAILHGDATCPPAGFVDHCWLGGHRRFHPRAVARLVLVVNATPVLSPFHARFRPFAGLPRLPTNGLHVTPARPRRQHAAQSRPPVCRCRLSPDRSPIPPRQSIPPRHTVASVSAYQFSCLRASVYARRQRDDIESPRVGAASQALVSPAPFFECCSRTARLPSSYAAAPRCRRQR